MLGSREEAMANWALIEATILLRLAPNQVRVITLEEAEH